MSQKIPDHYAGPGLRLAAFLIDSIIIIIPYFVITRLTGLNKINSEWPGVAINSGELILSWLYFSLSESSILQATIGKKTFGLTVEKVIGGKISFGQATFRFWSKFLSVFTLGFGFLMAAFNPRKQTLHDKLAKTVVLKARS